MATDAQVQAIEQEIQRLKGSNELTAERADLFLKEVELRTKIEELKVKKRETRHSKLLTFSPFAVPLAGVFFTFLGVI